MLRVALLACAGLISGTFAETPSSAATMPLDQAAKLFASRPAGFAPDLSPDGDKLVFLTAGPGASTIARIRDLAKGGDTVLVRSSGKPEQLDFCGFVDERWIICSFSGEMHEGDFVYRAGRTVAIDTTSGTMRPLSARVHDSDAFL